MVERFTGEHLGAGSNPSRPSLIRDSYHIIRYPHLVSTSTKQSIISNRLFRGSEVGTLLKCWTTESGDFFFVKRNLISLITIILFALNRPARPLEGIKLPIAEVELSEYCAQVWRVLSCCFYTIVQNALYFIRYY